MKYQTMLLKRAPFYHIKHTGPANPPGYSGIFAKKYLIFSEKFFTLNLIELERGLTEIGKKYRV